MAKKTVEKKQPASEGGRAWVRIECETEERHEIHMIITTEGTYEKLLEFLDELTEE